MPPSRAAARVDPSPPTRTRATPVPAHSSARPRAPLTTAVQLSSPTAADRSCSTLCVTVNCFLTLCPTTGGRRRRPRMPPPLWALVQRWSNSASPSRSRTATVPPPSGVSWIVCRKPHRPTRGRDCKTLPTTWPRNCSSANRRSCPPPPATNTTAIGPRRSAISTSSPSRSAAGLSRRLSALHQRQGEKRLGPDWARQPGHRGSGNPPSGHRRRLHKGPCHQVDSRRGRRSP